MLPYNKLYISFHSKRGSSLIRNGHGRKEKDNHDRDKEKSSVDIPVIGHGMEVVIWVVGIPVDVGCYTAIG